MQSKAFYPAQSLGCIKIKYWYDIEAQPCHDFYFPLKPRLQVLICFYIVMHDLDRSAQSNVR
jgi:hypothetical protein